MIEQVTHALELALLVVVDGYRISAVCLDHLHARDIGEPVADIEHIGKRNAALVIGCRAVEIFVVRYIEHALVYAIDKLGF